MRVTSEGRGSVGRTGGLVAAGSAAVAALLLSAGTASAVTIASDGFETATHPSGFRSVATASPAPGNNGVPFYAVKATGTATLAADAAVGGASPTALVTSGVAGGTNYALVGNLPLVGTLDNVNDNVTLSFRFRFLNQGTATASNANFRFGLFSSNGSVVTGENQTTNSDNDTGYYAQIGDAAQATNNLFYNEAGGTTTILSGTDRAVVNASTTVAAIADNAGHGVVFSLTRTSATAVALSLSIDGGAAVTGTAGGTLRTAFDEVAFSNAFVATSMNYAVDDVSVIATSFAIPEPTTGLAAAGALVGGMLVRRRRRDDR